MITKPTDLEAVFSCRPQQAWSPLLPLGAWGTIGPPNALLPPRTIGSLLSFVAFLTCQSWNTLAHIAHVENTKIKLYVYSSKTNFIRLMVKRLPSSAKCSVLQAPARNWYAQCKVFEWANTTAMAGCNVLQTNLSLQLARCNHFRLLLYA